MEVKRDLGEGELGRGKRPRILIFIPLHALFARIGVEPVTRASTVLDICVGVRGVRTVCFLFILFQPLSGDPAHAMQRWCHATAANVWTAWTAHTSVDGVVGQCSPLQHHASAFAVAVADITITGLSGHPFQFALSCLQGSAEAAMSVAHHTHASFHNIN